MKQKVRKHQKSKKTFVFNKFKIAARKKILKVHVFQFILLIACFHLLYDYFCMSSFFADPNKFKITTFSFVCNEYCFLKPSRFIASTMLTLLLIILPTSFNWEGDMCQKKKEKFNVLLIRVKTKSKDCFQMKFTGEVFPN